MPFNLSTVLSIAAAVLEDRADLVAENLALRHQLSCLMYGLAAYEEIAWTM